MMTDPKFVDVDGIRTRYFDKGRGEVLLLVHGSHMGAGCVRLLDDRIHGRVPSEIPVRVMIAGHIVSRKSCGPAPDSQI